MARRYDEEFNDEFVNYKTDEREDFDDVFYLKPKIIFIL